MKKKALVTGAGGFIGGHLVLELLKKNYDVYGIDLKEHEYFDLRKYGCNFYIGDLRNYQICKDIIDTSSPNEVYSLAADMGGAGYIFTGENDADIMHNSATINLNLLDVISKKNISPKIFYASSACMYPSHNQLDPNNPVCVEDSAYPANPDSEYGWEKLFSERLYFSYCRNKNFDVKIARFHNIFGPYGTWDGGKEKAPAALCRKISYAKNGDSVDIWGDGLQTRSFLYIDECIEGILRLMNSDFNGPVNIGSEEMVTINQLSMMIANYAKKNINLNHINGPQGVRGRCSDNNLIFEKLNWKPKLNLFEGIKKTYDWIDEQVKNK